MEYKLRFPAVRIRNYLLKTLLTVLVLFLMGGSFYAGFDPHDGRIAENVCVGGIDLGGMTPERAYRELKYASREVLERSVLWVDLPQSSIPLDPDDPAVLMEQRIIPLSGDTAAAGGDDETGSFAELGQDLGLQMTEFLLAVLCKDLRNGLASQFFNLHIRIHKFLACFFG